MRLSSVAGLSLLVAVVGSPASAQAPAAPKAQTARPPAGPSLLSEFRIGFSAHDPWGSERGSGAVAGEVLFAKPFTTADLFTSYFVPRPHLGGSLTVDSRTNFAYAGLTWSLDVSRRVFIEGSLGGAIHDSSGQTGVAAATRTALTCSPVFREAGSVGVRLSGQWSLVATVEHLSDPGACRGDRGLTNVGARIGYTF